MPLTNDTNLLAAFHDGEPRAERTIFDQYFHPLCLFTERITGDLLQAEDIVAETFQKLMVKRLDFPSLPQIKSFLYQAARNAAINYANAQKRHAGAHEQIRYLAGSEVADDDAGDVEIMRAELISEIYKEMDKLPDKCGKVFKMLFVEELSTAEIAEKLNINVQTVRTQKARAIELIRNALLKKNPRAALILGGYLSSVPLLKDLFGQG